MTEAEWLTCTSPRLMLRSIRRSAGDDIFLRSWFTRHAEYQLPREWRMFLATCCNRVRPLLNKRAQKLIEFANSFVDEAPTKAAVERVSLWFSGQCGIQSLRLLWGLCCPLSTAAGQLRSIAGHYAFRSSLHKSMSDWEHRATSAMRAAMDAEAVWQSELIRAVIGSPFKKLDF